MQRFFPSGVRGRPWSAARRVRGAIATWVQDRRRGRRPLMTVTAADFTLAWGLGKDFEVRLQVGRLALWKFQSFQLRTRLVSAPGSWTNRGAKTNFSSSLLWWSLSGLTEGEDYVFELTVTETSGVVTITEVADNIGFS